MATVPCTIVVFTEDKLHFPIKIAFVVIKQLFQYGVREISIKGDDKIFISLTYSPKEKTLKKKFGNLPLRYMRTKLENEEEFSVLEKVVKRYKFNLVDDENIEEFEALPSAPRKKRYLEAPEWHDDDDDDGTTTNLDINTPGTSSSSSSSAVKKQKKNCDFDYELINI